MYLNIINITCAVLSNQVLMTYTVFEIPVVPVNHVCALIVNLVHLSALMY